MFQGKNNGKPMTIRRKILNDNNLIVPYLVGIEIIFLISLIRQKKRTSF